MAKKVPFEVRVDVPRNLIRVHHRGHSTPAAMEACLAQVKAMLPQLQAGFTLLTDLSELESMELDCVTALAGTMDLMRAGGVRTVVRVVPDPAKDIGFNILSIIHYRRGIKIVTCKTLAEAERLLPK
jgi:hypothetical protein